jgi:putative ATP-binding cassette transporter
MPSILALPRDAWRLAKPYFNSEERWSARIKLAAVIMLNLALVGMDVVLNFWNGAFFNTLQQKDSAGFLHLLLTYQSTEDGFLPGFLSIAIVYIAVSVYRTYLRQWLEIDWRRWMTAHLLNDWLADRAYYRINLMSGTSTNQGTENPDQRIAEDVRDFVNQTLALSLDLMSNVVTLFSFIAILWRLSGPVEVFGLHIPGYMVWVALLYSAVGTLLTHFIGRPLVLMNFRKQRVEADFRFSLVRLRENIEGVALSRGEALERRTLGEQFAAISANWFAIMQRTKLLNGLVAGYGQLAGIFPIVVAAPRFFAGTLDLGGLTRIAGAFGSVQGAMSWFVTSYADLAVWRATIDRLSFFRAAIAAARKAAAEGVTTAHATDGDYTLANATLKLPDGRTLLETGHLALQPGRSVVFTGRSGSGKSTLFRAFAGIWPFGHGEIRPGAGRSLFLPQRPYFPLGTLRQTICYPADPAGIDGAAILQALDDVGLGFLSPQLDQHDAWGTRLSGGEQQRLAVARALLLKPDWLFLDEATASLDPQSEQALLAVLKQRLPHTTMVSIAHRTEVAAWHDVHYVVSRDEGEPARIEAFNPS